MSANVETDIEAVTEAAKILMEKMPPSKVARVMAACQIGRGDYTKERDILFAGKTVKVLAEEIVARPKK